MPSNRCSPLNFARHHQEQSLAEDDDVFDVGDSASNEVSDSTCAGFLG
jgi:hypothetical protein